MEAGFLRCEQDIGGVGRRCRDSWQGDGGCEMGGVAVDGCIGEPEFRGGRVLEAAAVRNGRLRSGTRGERRGKKFPMSLSLALDNAGMALTTWSDGERGGLGRVARWWWKRRWRIRMRDCWRKAGSEHRAPWWLAK